MSEKVRCRVAGKPGCDAKEDRRHAAAMECGRLPTDVLAFLGCAFGRDCERAEAKRLAAKYAEAVHENADE